MESALLIDNKDVPAASGETFTRLNPVTGEVASRAAAAGAADAIAAVEAAQAAFPAWAALGPNMRRKYLLDAAAAMQARTDDFIAAMAAETGASAGWAGFNVYLASSMLREAASLTTQIKGEIIPSDRPGCMALALRRPAGVVLGIAPWNAPVILGVRAVATALACGNTAILKSSELCPVTHRLIGEVLRDAGFPAGVCNVVSNAPDKAAEVVEAMIAHPAVRRINFTGSTRVGRIIAGMAAANIKPVLLELGGKAPLLVLDDADLDAAVAAVGFGAYMNSGQICMSTERVIVDDKIADQFVEKLEAKIATLPAGDPREGQSPLGSLVDPSATACIDRLIGDATAKGAILHRASEPNGTLVPAGFLDKVTADMAIYSDESFGPITAIIRVSGEEEAIRVANDSAYGLTSAVFTRDVGRGLRIAERIDAGMCHINGPTVHDEAQMPFGGTKASGYGRFGGTAGIAEFTEVKWVTINSEDPHYPI